MAYAPLFSIRYGLESMFYMVHVAEIPAAENENITWRMKIEKIALFVKCIILETLYADLAVFI